MTCNLKTAPGSGLLFDKLADTDLLLTSQRPAALERIGLGWETLQARFSGRSTKPARNGGPGHAEPGCNGGVPRLLDEVDEAMVVDPEVALGLHPARIRQPGCGGKMGRASPGILAVSRGREVEQEVQNVVAWSRAMEQFKQLHRIIDLKSAQENLRIKGLNVIRRAEMIIKDDLADPDIEAVKNVYYDGAAPHDGDE